MTRAKALLEGITAPVRSGFSIHERMNCISSSRRSGFFSTRTDVCNGIATGSRVRTAGQLARKVHGYSEQGNGSRWLLRIAATISQALKEGLDPAEEAGGFRLGVLRRQLVELGQQLALAFCQLLRGFDRDLDIEIAGLLRPQDRHSLTGQTETAPGLGSGRDLDLGLAAIDRRHCDLAAERRRHHRDRHPAVQVGAVALIELMRLQRQENIKVARRSAAHAGLALAGEPDAGAVLDTGRDVDRQHALARNASGALAGVAGVVDDLAAALARGAGALEREEALRMADLAGAAAGGAGLRLAAGLGAGARADFAGDRRRNANLGVLALEGFLEGDFHIVAQVRAALAAGTAAAATAAAATHPEQVFENVREGRREI